MVSARFIAKCLRVIDLWMWPLRGAQHSLLLWCTSLTRRDLRPCTLNNVAFLRVLLIKLSPTKGFVVSFDNYSLSLFHSNNISYLALRNESRRDMNECFCSPHPCSYSHRWTYYTAGVISRNWHTALCWLSCRTPQRANNNHCISWTSLHKVLQVRSCVK